MENVKNFIKKIKIFFNSKENKKLYIIFLLGCIGILLISLSEFSSSASEVSASKSAISTNPVFEPDEKLETRLEEEISKISGAGKTSVMLTFDSSKEYFYAKNSNESVDENEKNREQEFVVIEGKDGDEPIILKTAEAKVRGVLVVCEGGNNAVVREKIIEALCALLDISSNHISVAGMALSQ